MTTKDTALRLALEALETGRDYAIESRDEHARTFGDHPATAARLALIGADIKAINESITACREALAQPAGERGELVQDIHLIQTKMVGSMLFDQTDVAVLSKASALLSSDAQPSEWVSISDDEIYGMYTEPRSDAEMVEFARELESKLKEKNHGK